MSEVVRYLTSLAQALAAQQQAAAPAQAITAAPVQSMTVDQPAAVAQPASRA